MFTSLQIIERLLYKKISWKSNRTFVRQYPKGRKERDRPIFNLL